MTTTMKSNFKRPNRAARGAMTEETFDSGGGCFLGLRGAGKL
jgi:hypothetical protein